MSGAKIPLTRGQFALVDLSDYDDLARFKWHVIQPGRVMYAARDGRRAAGLHETAERAARARDRLALELHGEFARLNFPAEAS